MEQTYTTIFATSSTVAARWITERGDSPSRTFQLFQRFTGSFRSRSFIIAAKPSDIAGPGSTLFTVTPLLCHELARPRASESWAVFLSRHSGDHIRRNIAGRF